MDHQVRELTGLLERQAALYHDLASVLTREKEAAVAASTDALEAIRLEKEPLLEVLAAVEKQRIQATQRLAQAVGLESEPVTLSVLASRLGGSAAQGLHQCRQVLVRRIETVGAPQSGSGGSARVLSPVGPGDHRHGGPAYPARRNVSSQWTI